MSYVFLPDAQEEFFEAILRYDREQPGLGSEFDQSIELVINAILENPTLWRKRPDGHRRVNCKRFPYYLAYYIRAETIVIAAVAHASRKPGYWKNRLGR
jgi:toxin ParE1/3/4